MLEAGTDRHDEAKQPEQGRKKRRAAARLAVAVGPLLDRGMSVYRRHFTTFLVVSLIWSLPLAGLAFVNELPVWLGWFRLNSPGSYLWPLLLSGALLLAMADALSRIAAVADSGGNVSWRLGLKLRPLRLLGMALLSLIYTVLGAMLAFVCACIGIFTVGRMTEVLGDLLWNSPAAELFVLIIVFSALLLYWVILGSFGAGLCYALQPLIQDEGPILRAVGAGLRLLLSDLRGTVRLCAGAALTAGGFGVSIASSVVALTIVPFSLFNVSTDGTFYTALLSGLYFLSYLVALPPLLIWSALAYRRRRGAELQAAELEQRIKQMLQAPRARSLN